MLIVEDGTGLSSAESYISLADARNYAVNYGYTLPVDDTEAEIALRKAALYVDLFEASFSGSRLNDAQSLSWPRIDAYRCYGYKTIDLPSNSVPSEVKYAQVIAAATIAVSEVRANNDGKNIASEEVVGAVKVSYFDNGTTGGNIEITAANDMLSAYMCNSTNGLSIRTERA